MYGRWFRDELTLFLCIFMNTIAILLAAINLFSSTCYLRKSYGRPPYWASLNYTLYYCGQSGTVQFALIRFSHINIMRVLKKINVLFFYDHSNVIINKNLKLYYCMGN